MCVCVCVRDFEWFPALGRTVITAACMWKQQYHPEQVTRDSVRGLSLEVPPPSNL